MLKRIIRYAAMGLAALVVLLVGVLAWLYLSADMKQPVHAFTEQGRADVSDSLRTYRGNWLRHSRSGLWELRVDGDAFERGDAIGKLGTDLLHYQEQVFVDQIRRIIPSDAYLSILRFFIVIFNRHLGENIPEEFRDEIYGISQSCSHEYDAIGTPYERQLNYHAAHDIGHAMQDYMMVGCSSFACWGESSADSSLLVGRNFDFYVGDGFARNKLVSFYRPARGYKFASVGWAGMTGVLSGMNEAGLTVTINAAKSDVPTSSATPISILTREILQYAATIDEAYRIASKRRTFVSESILIGSARDGKAAIIEKSPEKIALFTATGDRILCTNHYQSELYRNDPRNIENIRTSDSPYRFARLQELLAREAPVTPSKAADILRDRRGLHDAELGLTNELALNQLIAHHSVIFQPGRLRMWVSTDPWQCGKYVAYDLRKVFSDTLDYRREITSGEIPADAFLQTAEYQDALRYKKLTPIVHAHIRHRQRLTADTLGMYEACNPHFYYTHRLLGDYYERVEKDAARARACWQKALGLPIPHLEEKEALQKKIREQ